MTKKLCSPNAKKALPAENFQTLNFGHQFSHGFGLKIEQVILNYDNFCPKNICHLIFKVLQELTQLKTKP